MSCTALPNRTRWVVVHPGRIMPTGRAAPNGVAVLIGPSGRSSRTVLAPIAPGLLEPVGVDACEPLRPGVTRYVGLARCSIALDGNASWVRPRRPDRRHAGRRRSPRDRCSRGAGQRMFLLLNHIDEFSRRGDPMTQMLSSLGADAPDASGLTRPSCWTYTAMRSIRAFEDRVHDEFATGDIPGFVHLYAGEEASATGVCAHLGPIATPSRPRTAGTATASPRGRHQVDDGRDLRQADGIVSRQGRLDAYRRPRPRACSARTGSSAADHR